MCEERVLGERTDSVLCLAIRGTSWHIVAHCGTSRHILAHRCILWHIMTHPGTSWHFLAYCGTSWNILAHPGISRQATNRRLWAMSETMPCKRTLAEEKQTREAKKKNHRMAESCSCLCSIWSWKREVMLMMWADLQTPKGR